MALTVKLTRQQRRVDTAKLKNLKSQKRQRENNNELQDNSAANQTNNEIRRGRHTPHTMNFTKGKFMTNKNNNQKK